MKPARRKGKTVGNAEQVELAADSEREPEVIKLGIFISYASEDRELALAIHNAITSHVDKDFAEVFIDVEGMKSGFDLNSQIRDQLKKTDILIVVYTGQEKESHGFTGLELGYFMRDKDEIDRPVERSLVVFYLEKMPITAAGLMGIKIGVGKDVMALDESEYEASLKSSQDDQAILNFLKQIEALINKFRKIHSFPDWDYQEEGRKKTSTNMLVQIFRALRKRKDVEVNPQRKIVLTIKDAFGSAGEDLPGNSIMSGDQATMSIFGISNTSITWENFVRDVSSQFKLIWKSTIEKVVFSSLDQLEADNSQIIVSGIDQDIYRVILTKRIRYNDGSSEFHLYLVKVLKPNALGNERTTRILKALGLCCRFRFMFFETASDFCSFRFRAKTLQQSREAARALIRELDFLSRDAFEAKLNDEGVWADFTDWPTIIAMTDAYRPLDKELRLAARDILVSKDEETGETAKAALIRAVQNVELAMDEPNMNLIEGLSAALITNLRVLPKNGERESNKPTQQGDGN